MAHVRIVRDQREASELMLRLGVDPKGCEIMAPKAVFRVLIIEGLDARRANILKQEALACGAEAAVPWGAIAGSQHDEKVAVFGTESQLRRLCHKLRQQPFKLAIVADGMEATLGNFTNSSLGVMKLRKGRLDFGRQPLIMGIINVTPDSFSDGGKNFKLANAISEGKGMAREGADILDVGGESTRPGAKPVSVETELKRVIPVIESLAKAVKIPISIDTRHAKVAEAALDAGASIVNDVSALGEPSMARLVAERKCPVVLMHMLGNPRTMQDSPSYGDVVEDVARYLEARVRHAESKGISRDRIIVDPGIGFGKAAEHNLEILRRLAELRSLGLPILVGPSRKAFIGKILDLPAGDRLEGTLAAVSAAVLNGADIVRVHDVAECRKAAMVAWAIRAGVEHTGH
ncbi:MAG: dihydropteroate synthase [Methanobacteriota archaeon]